MNVDIENTIKNTKTSCKSVVTFLRLILNFFESLNYYPHLKEQLQSRQEYSLNR